MSLENFLPLLETGAAFGHFIRLILDNEGTILSSPGGSNATEQIFTDPPGGLNGNLKAFFDLGNARRLDDIPAVKKGGMSRSFYNRPGAVWLEEPERFYTLLPTLILHILKLRDNEFLGLCRLIGMAPNLSLEGVSSLIYVDRKDRLAGFNQSFLDLFEERPADPFSWLGRPVGRFFSPSPREIQEEQLGLHPMPRTGALRETPGLDFPRETLDNATAETRFVIFPFTADMDRDFLWTVELEVLAGAPPGLVAAAPLEKGDHAKFTPDARGYLLGPHFTEPCYALKRLTVQRTMGAKVGKTPPASLSLCKTGNVLRLLADGAIRLEYFDFDFLRSPAAILALAIRPGSSCRVRGTRLSVSGEKRPAENLLPKVRFRNRSGQVALLRHVTNLHVMTSFPEVSAYLLENVTEIQRQISMLERENLRLRQQVPSPAAGFIGQSSAMVSLKKNAARVASADATILIQGPTGSGKEMLARYIHDLSPRKNSPFTKVDCSTLAPSLMESELFGHEKGAFTGAQDRHTGYFERAQGGTIFLDEAGNLSMAAQAKLLHFLQERVITRVGGREPIRLDVRVIVASQAPLMELVRKGLFREDLFYRMDVVGLTLPPLSERKEDLPELCRHFLDQFASAHNKEVKGLSPEAFRKLASHSWPGNVRELRNTLERAVLFTDTPVIQADHITFPEEAASRPKGKRGPYRIGALDIEQLKKTLKEKGGNLKEAAKALKVPRQTIYFKLKRLGLNALELRRKSS